MLRGTENKKGERQIEKDGERLRGREKQREVSKHCIDFDGDVVTRRSWLNMNGGCATAVRVDQKPNSQCRRSSRGSAGESEATRTIARFQPISFNFALRSEFEVGRVESVEQRRVLSSVSRCSGRYAGRVTSNEREREREIC